MNKKTQPRCFWFRKFLLFCQYVGLMNFWFRKFLLFCQPVGLMNFVSALCYVCLNCGVTRTLYKPVMVDLSVVCYYQCASLLCRSRLVAQLCFVTVAAPYLVNNE